MGHSMIRGAGMMGGLPLGGVIPVIIGLALIAAVVVLIIRNSKLKKALGGNLPKGAVLNAKIDAPESILRERLAKGDIDEAEFDKILLKLKG